VVAVSATFTAEPLSLPIEFWMRRLGLDLAVKFAPYHQIFQQLLDPASLLAQNRGGINVVLVRFEDWVRYRSVELLNVETLEETVRYLVSCLRLAAESFSSPLLVSICPSSPGFLEAPERASFARGAEESIATSLRGLTNVHFISPAELEALYPVSLPHDPDGDVLGHVPYTPEYFTALGSLLSRKIHALRLVPYKVIALDCDDTLWQGICGEDGPEEVIPRGALQQFIVAQHDAGMLLCLCSKNNEEDVLETFRCHPDMPLRLEHCIAHRINWAAKSANLAALAGELQLGLDSFVFVDDNPQECAEVQSGRPEVLTLPLPADPSQIPDFLQHVWAFDRIQVTAEDKRRTELYSQRIERTRIEKQAQTLGEFIAALQLETGIAPILPHQLYRVAQLTQRTNQMNLTTVRRSEADLHALLRSGSHECLTVEVSDRFGGYGLTGAAIVEPTPDALIVDTFLLSCRVLGRGVEHRLLARLGELALEKGLRWVDVPFVPTQRNRPALLFLESVGAQYKEPSANGFRFRFPAGAAAGIAYAPASALPRFAAEPDRSLTVAALKRQQLTEQRASACGLSASFAATSVDFGYIAANLRTVSQIQEQMRAETRNGVAHVTAAAAPRTELERQLAGMWADLLSLPSVGIHDNFFDLGGHSLLAVQLLSRVRQTFRVDLALDVVYGSAFTVAELAKVIEVSQIEQAGADRYAGILAEIEGLSDEEVRALLAQETEAAESGGGR
jgi:FkbH-like protein